MPVNTPKLAEIRDSIVSDLKSSLGITTAIFGKNFLYVFAGVIAAKLKLFYLVTADVQKNVAPDLADTEANGGTLERFGRLSLGRNPFPAEAGVYTVQVTGEIGGTIKSGTVFKSNDDSSNPTKSFVIDDDFTLTAPIDSISLRALVGGTSQALIVGDKLTSTTPILNVDSLGEVTAITVTAIDAEPTVTYRNKVVQSERLEPQGGAASDFRLWSYDAVGVRESYPYAKSGASAEVIIYVEVEKTVDSQGIAPPDVLENVAEVIEYDPDITKPDYERGRRPIGVFDVEVVSITPLNLDVTINGLTDNSAYIQGLITDSITSYMEDVRPFVAGADVFENKNDIISINKLSYVVISAIPDNVLFTSLSLVVDGRSTNSFNFTDGFIPYVQSVNFL